jgi:hypothetical protein
MTYDSKREATALKPTLSMPVGSVLSGITALDHWFNQAR